MRLADHARKLPYERHKSVAGAGRTFADALDLTA